MTQTIQCLMDDAGKVDFFFLRKKWMLDRKVGNLPACVSLDLDSFRYSHANVEIFRRNLSNFDCKLIAFSFKHTAGLKQKSVSTTQPRSRVESRDSLLSALLNGLLTLLLNHAVCHRLPLHH